MKKTGRITIRSLVMVFIASIIVASDQWSKAWVRQNLSIGESYYPLEWLRKIVWLTHVQNTGAAFGLLQPLGGVFALVAILVVAMILFYFRHLAETSWLLVVAFGLQLGGAIGNLIDRLTRGYVTDFVDFGWWPVFNVADSSVVCGTILLGIYVLFLDSSSRQSATAPTSDAEEQGSG